MAPERLSFRIWEAIIEKSNQHMFYKCNALSLKDGVRYCYHRAAQAIWLTSHGGDEHGVDTSFQSRDKD